MTHFFSNYRDNCPGKLNNLGLIDQNNVESENYYFVKDTIMKRLSGWYGKTLKKIHRKRSLLILIFPLITQFLVIIGWNQFVTNMEMGHHIIII